MRYYLDIDMSSHAQRSQAVAIGARWDKQARKYYVTHRNPERFLGATESTAERLLAPAMSYDEQIAAREEARRKKAEWKAQDEALS